MMRPPNPPEAGSWILDAGYPVHPRAGGTDSSGIEHRTSGIHRKETDLKIPRLTLLAAACAALALPVSAQKVTIDYAHGFDVDGVETFQYVDSPESNIQDNTLMADRVVSMIKKELREGGLREVEGSPDLYVTYHFTSQGRQSYSTTTMGYDAFRGFLWI
jgi:hypothetical protein